jgi:hypothetical protein
MWYLNLPGPSTAIPFHNAAHPAPVYGGNISQLDKPPELVATHLQPREKLFVPTLLQLYCPPLSFIYQVKNLGVVLSENGYP